MGNECDGSNQQTLHFELEQLTSRQNKIFEEHEKKMKES